jgi:uncharacterized protein
MILKIHQLDEIEEYSLDLDAQQCHLPPDIGTLNAPLHLEARVQRVGEEITITGRLATTLTMKCSRCLRPFQASFAEDFEVVYCPQPESEALAEEIELNETDLNVSYYEGDTISLADVARDQLLLLLPIKPLCKPDCAGLCPICGKDLNEGPCTCTPQSVDPRLAVLEQLLDSESSTQ